MIENRFLLLALMLAGGAVAAFEVARHSRHLDRRQLKTDLHTWEDEGGNPAPSTAQRAVPT